MLTANDIHNKEFKRSFRGDDEDEIDEFLDQVVNDFDLLSRENVSLKADLARAEKTNEEYKQLKDDINNTLLMAQKTAADQMAAAKQAASEQRENTAKECQNMKREAEIAARKTVNDAQAEGERILNDARAKAQAVIAEYDRLVRSKNRYLRHIKQSLEAQLAVVDQTLSEVPDPDKQPIDEEETKPAPELSGTQAEALQEAVAAKNGDDASADTKDAKADEADPSDGKDEKTSHGQWQPHAGASAQNRQDVQDR